MGLGACADGDTIASSSTDTRAATCFISTQESYNQLVATRRPILVTLLAGLVAASPAAQTPSLDEVLKRSATYVAAFHKQLSGIVAEETYRQESASTAAFVNFATSGESRTLKSDLLLVKPADSDRYVELRDVFEVDGQPVRDRQARLEGLLRNPTKDSDAQIRAILKASAEHNIGVIQRNINTPLMALQILDKANQSRFTFKHVEKSKPVFQSAKDRAINETPVFRVSTEMWTIEYRERDRSTLIRTPEGRSLPAKGRFWIDPSNGSVLISELVIDGGGVLATVTVSYQSEPLMGFLVPVEMRESYVRRNEHISGHATYGKFRPIAK